MNFDEDKKEMVQAALPANGGNYPSRTGSYHIQTAPTNSDAWNGKPPPLITTAACAAEQASGKLALAAACSYQCASIGPLSADGGSPDAAVSSVTCLEAACTNTVVAAFNGDLVCQDCFLLYIQSFFPIAYAQQECGTDTHDPYGQYNWGGNNGELILSQHPIVSSEAYIFPGTIFRRALLHTVIQVNANTKLDVYCGQFVYADKGLQVMNYTASTRPRTPASTPARVS